VASDTAQPIESSASKDDITALAHLYRAEMNRMSVWRQRLDVTSNWSVILATALTTFTLGSPDVPHYTLLLGLGLVIISILLEGRRYRHLHHSKWRLYLLESGFFANVLQPSNTETSTSDWRTELAADLRRTQFEISWLTGMRVRLRRNYLFVIGFMAAVWIAKLFIHPTRATDFADLYSRLHVGDFIPSWMVAASALAFFVAAAVLGVTCPPAEQLEDWGGRQERS
jgi:uncharacterized membrane protein